MTPKDYPSIFHFPIDLNEDQPQQLLTYHHDAPSEAASNSSTSKTDHDFIDTIVEGERDYHSESLLLRHEKADTKLSLSKKEGNNNRENKSQDISFKWMSSKMRLMRKMMSPDQVAAATPEGSIQKFEDHKEQSSLLQIDNSSLQNSPNSSSNTIRVCADCNTTKTPLWRSGPRGPKSLCNACGIRQRKARRAAMAAGASGTPFVANTPTMKSKTQQKGRKISNKHIPFKKRCKFRSSRGGASKKLCFEGLTILNNSHSAFQRVCPQDEKEAAILLMSLSHGLVHG